MQYCTHCGKELLSGAVVCLNCGCAIEKSNSVALQQATKFEAKSKLATWSKILGITSFFFGWFVFGILAVILALFSKNETNGKLCNSANVGLVCGIVSTILSLMIVFCIIEFLMGVQLFVGTIMSFIREVTEVLNYLQSLIETF
ncbi:MAG: zinc-ribbon domain-containing protein [Clostridia bacterium]|nr:zinc-ribbon domain-containing protein [Clostridia bacterium]